MKEITGRNMACGLVEVRCPFCRGLHSHRVPNVTAGAAERRADCGNVYRIQIQAR